MKRSLVGLALMIALGCSHAPPPPGPAPANTPAAAPAGTSDAAFHWWSARCCRQTVFAFDPALAGDSERAQAACEQRRTERTSTQPTCARCGCEVGSGRLLPSAPPL